jgi:threonine/homoserine/homoserine lactone efflux protein
METLATASMVLAAAITPGPNNLVVMQVGARSGWVRALPEVTGIVLGGLAIFSVVVLGGEALFGAVPVARPLVTLAGCLYLGWLGVSQVLETLRSRPLEQSQPAPLLPSGAAGLFAFQFLNPKCWVTVVTATAAARDPSMVATVARLVPLFVVIWGLSLLAWAAIGSLLARALRRRQAQLWFDRVMGVLLAGSAALLLVEP